MASLSWAARAYIWTVSACALALWLASIAAVGQASVAALGPDVLVFAVAVTVGEFMSVSLPRGGWLSVSTIPSVATVLLFPVPVSMAIAAVSMLVEQVHAREPWYKATFNVSSSALAIGLSGSVFTLATGGVPGRVILASDGTAQMVALAAVAVAYYVLNKALTQIVVSLATGRSLKSVVVGNSQYTLAPELSMTLIGGLLALLWVSHPVWSLAIILPTFVTYRTLEYVRRLQTETEAAVVALADIVDSRDTYTFQHSRRVAAYAEAIAGELGQDGADVDLIVSAAKVHDLGKIGIPDAVLLKPGRLDDGETRQMQTHSAMGAEILGRFQLYREGTKLALHHHEWYDGRGYPEGLRGDAIPVGARIIAVADAFDAMTSDRPYRRAMTAEEALDRLQEGQGRQFDPMVVAAMLQLAASGELALASSSNATRSDDTQGDETPSATRPPGTDRGSEPQLSRPAPAS